MKLISLKEIEKATNGRLFGDSSKTVAAINTNSKNAVENSLFIAIVGDRFDGHDFANAAIKGGATALLVEKEANYNTDYILVPDTKEALLSFAAYYKSLFNIKTVAITGSVGKTTTKEFVYSVLSSKYKTLKSEGNLNNHIGLPLTIFNLNDTHEACILEMGMNHFGEIEKLTAVAKPDIALITNIGISHIENLGSRENILKAKLEILKSLSKDGTVILNGDEPLLYALKGKTGFKELFFGINNINCDIYATEIISQSDKTNFVINFGGKQYKGAINTAGIHNVYNAVAAFAVSVVYDIDYKIVIKSLLNFQNAEKRQHIYKNNGYTIIDDSYNASPDSMIASLSVLSDLKCSGNKIAVLSDMYELGDFTQASHKQVGTFAGKAVNYLYLTGKYADYYAEGARESGLPDQNIFIFHDRIALAKKLKKKVKNGDAVLFKGSRASKTEEILKFFLEEAEK